MRRKISIELLDRLAASRGGKCITRHYKNVRQEITLVCAQGHRWKARASGLIYHGSWCAQCAGVPKLSIRDMRDRAAAFGGVCLSKKYVNSHAKLQWQCAQGHVFWCNSNNVKSGRWCPRCRIWKGEEIVRQIFEKAFNAEFKKARPRWLRNSRGNQMELDGYNEELRLAFEHHGQQHFRTIDRFYKTDAGLVRRRADDRRKRQLASSRGVHLIEVPAVPHLTSIDNLPKFIARALRKAGIAVPRRLREVRVDYRDIFSQDLLRDVRTIVRRHKGALLDDSYKGALGKLAVRCRAGHEFRITPTMLKTGSWCRTCRSRNHIAPKRERALQRLRTIAKRRGGVLESSTHPSIHHPLRWRCAKGHRFKLSSRSAKSGVWCRFCKDDERLLDLRKLVTKHSGELLSKTATSRNSTLRIRCASGHVFRMKVGRIRQGRWCQRCHVVALRTRFRYTIRDLIAASKRHQGHCLSDEFVGVAHKHRFKCSRNHVFERLAYEVLKDKWCPMCRGRGRTIADMQKLAASKGGSCQSMRYINSVTKLEWRCAKGHVWKTVPKVIVRGGWCPTCSKNRSGKVK